MRKKENKLNLAQGAIFDDELESAAGGYKVEKTVQDPKSPNQNPVYRAIGKAKGVDTKHLTQCYFNDADAAVVWADENLE